MSGTGIFDLIQSLGDKESLIEEIINHCTKEYDDPTTGKTKKEVIASTQEYAADALVRLYSLAIYIFFDTSFYFIKYVSFII